MGKTISQSFTPVGWAGVTLLLCGPMACAIGFLELFRTRDLLMLQGITNTPGIGLYVAAGFVGTFATIAAIPMMMIGREYRVSSIGGNEAHHDER